MCVWMNECIHTCMCVYECMNVYELMYAFVWMKDCMCMYVHIDCMHVWKNDWCMNMCMFVNEWMCLNKCMHACSIWIIGCLIVDMCEWLIVSMYICEWMNECVYKCIWMNECVYECK